MQEPPESLSPQFLDTAPAEPWPPARRRTGYRGVAWLLIVAVVVLKFVGSAYLKGEEAATEGAQLDDVVMELQGRYLVGAAESVGNGPMLFTSAAPGLDVGPVGQRQRLIVLAAEVAGTREASDRFAELQLLIETERQDNGFELSEKEAAVQDVLATLYPALPDDAEPAEVAEGETPPGPRVDLLTDDQRDTLIGDLGWFGQLAVVPRGSAEEAARDAVIGPAVRTFVVAITVVMGAGGLGVVGFIGLVVLVILAYLGRLRSGVQRGVGHDGIYAETFALWLIGFIALQLAVGAIAPMIASPALQTFAIAAAFFASLIALAWPVFRGVPWSDVRSDIGWTAGRKPLLEPLIGLAGYAMTLPLLAVGVGLTYVLMMVDASIGSEAPEFSPIGGPAHPVVLEVAKAACSTGICGTPSAVGGWR